MAAISASAEEVSTCFMIMASQWIKNIGDEPLTFLCIVHPFWKIEDEIV